MANYSNCQIRSGVVTPQDIKDLIVQLRTSVKALTSQVKQMPQELVIDGVTKPGRVCFELTAIQVNIAKALAKRGT